MDEPAEFRTFCHRMILGDKIRAVDIAATGVLKWVLVESKREQDAPKHPQIHLLIDDETVADIQADVGHFRRSVKHCNGLVDHFL